MGNGNEENKVLSIQPSAINHQIKTQAINPNPQPYTFNFAGLFNWAQSKNQFSKQRGLSILRLPLD
jgi:hypothetical protein